MVDAYELAERISYFIWADMPDAELTALAKEGKLADPQIRANQVRRMLDDLVRVAYPRCLQHSGSLSTRLPSAM